jgi:hypothetical protein
MGNHFNTKYLLFFISSSICLRRFNYLIATIQSIFGSSAKLNKLTTRSRSYSIFNKPICTQVVNMPQGFHRIVSNRASRLSVESSRIRFCYEWNFNLQKRDFFISFKMKPSVLVASEIRLWVMQIILLQLKFFMM